MYIEVDIDPIEVLDEMETEDIIAYLRDKDSTLAVDNLTDTWESQILHAAEHEGTDRVLELVEQMVLYSSGKIVEL